MARSAADTALLLETIAGYDPADPGSAPAPRLRFTDGIDGGVKGLRVGFVRHFHETDMPADPEVAAGLEAMAKLLEEEGAHVRTVTLPTLQSFSAVNRVIMEAEAWSIHAPWLKTRPGDYARVTRQRLMPGAFLSAGDYVAAQRERPKMIAAVDAALREVDVLLCASSMMPACRIDDWDAVTRTYSRQARTPFNVTGHPAISLMSGLSSAGLPLSAQIVGRTHAGSALFAVPRIASWRPRRSRGMPSDHTKAHPKGRRITIGRINGPQSGFLEVSNSHIQVNMRSARRVVRPTIAGGRFPASCECFSPG
jgi:aspartyl-tRNA(Asn)/glutamyl-tRNA(Gln) amidotransferase subunit A